MRLSLLAFLLAILPARVALGEILPAESFVRLLHPKLQNLMRQHEGKRVVQSVRWSKSARQLQSIPSVKPYVLFGTLEADVECDKMFGTIYEQILDLDDERAYWQSLMMCFGSDEGSWLYYSASIEPLTEEDANYVEEHVKARQGRTFWDHAFYFKKALAILNRPDFKYFDVKWDDFPPVFETPAYSKMADLDQAWANVQSLGLALEETNARVLDPDAETFLGLVDETFGAEEAEFVRSGIFPFATTAVVEWAPRFLLEDLSVVPYTWVIFMVRNCQASPTGFCG